MMREVSHVCLLEKELILILETHLPVVKLASVHL